MEEKHYDKLLSFKYSLFYSIFVILSTSLLDIHIHYLLNRYKTNYKYNQYAFWSWLCHINSNVHKMWIIQKNLSKESIEQLRLFFLIVFIVYYNYFITFWLFNTIQKIVNKIFNLLNNNHLDLTLYHCIYSYSFDKLF